MDTMATLIQQVLCPKLFSSNRKQHTRHSGQQWTTVVSPDVSLRIIFMIKVFMNYSLWICFLLSLALNPDKHTRLSHFSKLFQEQTMFLIKGFFFLIDPFHMAVTFPPDITLRVRSSNVKLLFSQLRDVQMKGIRQTIIIDQKLTRPWIVQIQRDIKL